MVRLHSGIDVPLSQWRQQWSRAVRERVLGHYLVPDSRHGLDPGLVPHLPPGVPISLIDVGANRGDFASVIARHCGLTRALLVEPQAERCVELAARFQEQPVEIVHGALLDRPGEAILNVPGADSCSSLLDVQSTSFADRGIDVATRDRQPVPVTTLDALLAARSWEGPIDLLKLDTQGTELQILHGAPEALSRVRLLWIEVSFKSLYQGDALFHEIHAELTRAGCRLYSLHDGVFRGADGELLQADALFLGPQETRPVR
jgi:FkbM family methyltransferase